MCIVGSCVVLVSYGCISRVVFVILADIVIPLDPTIPQQPEQSVSCDPQSNPPLPPHLPLHTATHHSLLSIIPAKAVQEMYEKDKAEREKDKGRKIGAYEKIKRQQASSACVVA